MFQGERAAFLEQQFKAAKKCLDAVATSVAGKPDAVETEVAVLLAMRAHCGQRLSELPLSNDLDGK